MIRKQLPTLAEFRLLRDQFQSERRAFVLPQLKTRKTALEAEIKVFYRKLAFASKHEKQVIENDMRPLQWDYQYICGQLAVIEGDMAMIAAAA